MADPQALGMFLMLSAIAVLVRAIYAIGLFAVSTHRGAP